MQTKYTSWCFECVQIFLCTPCIFVVYAGSRWLTTVLFPSLLQLTYQSELSVCQTVRSALSWTGTCDNSCMPKWMCLCLLHKLLVPLTCIRMYTTGKHDTHTFTTCMLMQTTPNSPPLSWELKLYPDIVLKESRNSKVKEYSNTVMYKSLK